MWDGFWALQHHGNCPLDWSILASTQFTQYKITFYVELVLLEEWKHKVESDACGQSKWLNVLHICWQALSLLSYIHKLICFNLNLELCTYHSYFCLNCVVYYSRMLKSFRIEILPSDIFYIPFVSINFCHIVNHPRLSEFSDSNFASNFMCQ